MLEDVPLTLVPPAQLERRAAVNATDAPLPPALLHTLFEESLARSPDAPAVITPDRSLSYAELHRRANALRRRLGDVPPNELVAVATEKGWEQVVAVLAVLRAGGAYLPLDPALPAERFARLVERGGARRVIAQERLAGVLPVPGGVDVVAVSDADDSSPGDEQIVAARQQPTDLAYVIFTSGSTGEPKGVMIDHRGAVNTVLDVNRRFGVGPQDRTLGLSSLSFDLSVWDVFGLLAAGGAVVLIAPGAARDPSHWLELMRRERVTVWNSVPMLMDMLVEYAAGEELPDALRLAMLSGDWIPVTLPERLRALRPGVQVISLGGATEASIWSIWFPVDEVDPEWTSIPYGRPLANQRFHVLDERLEPRPEWVPGELYIGGDGVAQGYWRDPQRTAESFVTHPRTGERLYRTGDLGRYLPSGDIEFLGREDLQVKVGGYRVELGEIEAALEDHPDVRQAVVAAHGDPRGARRLVGYVVLEDGAAVSGDALREFLAAKLPVYMVPPAFMALDEVPLSANGKVDRSVLPEPDTAGATGEYVAPRDEVEELLARLWAEHLGLPQVGIHDRFLELGGDSMMAVRIIAAAEREGLTIAPADFFERQTIAEMAEATRAVAA